MIHPNAFDEVPWMRAMFRVIYWERRVRLWEWPEEDRRMIELAALDGMPDMEQVAANALREFDFTVGNLS